jgi:integral membrane protein
MLKTTIGQLRIVALLEGLSFLILLGIAMPLKYMAGIPQAVSIVGMAHGVLFIAYIIWAVLAKSQYKMSLMELFWSLVASVLPFGTFVADARIFKKYAVQESV